MSIPKPPFHTTLEELVYQLYLKLDGDMNGLKAEDINTLAKLNSIIIDADVVGMVELQTMLQALAQSVKGNVPPVADNLEKIYSIIQALNFLTRQDIDTLAELNSIINDADLIKSEDLTTAINSTVSTLKGNVPPNADTLGKLYALIQGLNFLSADDIDTLAELNAILSDADLIKQVDLDNAISMVSPNKWGYADLGNISTLLGAEIINLTGQAIIKFTQTGNIAAFDFSGEVVGRHYLFIIERTANHSFLLNAGRFYLPFGHTIVLTDPTTNGSAPAFSRDIITALCIEPGRLVLVPSHNFLPN